VPAGGRACNHALTDTANTQHGDKRTDAMCTCIFTDPNSEQFSY